MSTDITAEALRGPWLAVLADSDGWVHPTVAEARKTLPDDAEMTISIVRGSAMPVASPEGLRDARTDVEHYADDIALETGAYLVDGDDPGLGAEARYAQAQAMATGLNAAGGAE